MREKIIDQISDILTYFRLVHESVKDTAAVGELCPQPLHIRDYLFIFLRFSLSALLSVILVKLTSVFGEKLALALLADHQYALFLFPIAKHFVIPGIAARIIYDLTP